MTVVKKRKERLWFVINISLTKKQTVPRTDQADRYLSENQLLNLALRRKHHIFHTYSCKTPCRLFADTVCFFILFLFGFHISETLERFSFAAIGVCQSRLPPWAGQAQHRTMGPVVNFVTHIPVGYYFELVINWWRVFVFPASRLTGIYDSAPKTIQRNVWR